MAIFLFPTFPFCSIFFSFTSDLKKRKIKKDLEQKSCFLFRQEIFFVLCMFFSVISIMHQVRKKTLVLCFLQVRTNTLWDFPNSANPCLVHIIFYTNCTYIKKMKIKKGSEMSCTRITGLPDEGLLFSTDSDFQSCSLPQYNLEF